MRDVVLKQSTEMYKKTMESDIYELYVWSIYHIIVHFHLATDFLLLQAGVS